MKYSLAALLLLGACSIGLTREAPDKQRYVLDPAPPEAQPRNSDAVLELRPLYVHRTYAGRAFVTVAGDGAIDTTFYDEWHVAPAEAVHDSLLLWLDGCSGARAVVPVGSRLPVTHRLECEVLRLGAEIRGGERMAVVALRAVLLHGDQSLAGEFLAEEPLDGPTPQAYAGAVRKALARVLANLCQWTRAQLGP